MAVESPTKLETRINEDVARIRNVANMLLDTADFKNYSSELAAAALQTAYSIVADANLQEEMSKI